MKVLKRVYASAKVDEYPYIVNIGHHANVINLVTCSPAPAEVKVNGQRADIDTINQLIEKIKLRFPHKEAKYVLEEI